ncbi:hypothetical protein V5F77_04620 [Xanthobacter sp. DSM 24535]|uniref:hypothetical protein n=1 Tax=Roseixanthobacter psychrophilus TaxID=3119917 RepID=UPI003729734B
MLSDAGEVEVKLTARLDRDPIVTGLCEGSVRRRCIAVSETTSVHHRHCEQNRNLTPSGD